MARYLRRAPNAIFLRPRRRSRGGFLVPFAILIMVAAFAWQRGAFDAVLKPQSPAARAPATETASTIPELIAGRAVGVVDGDGLVLETGHEIRLGDFNAPELNQPGGREAKQALTDIAYGQSLACTPCEGARNPGRCTSYDRIIATCRLNGQRLGDLMRDRGIAEGGR